MKSEAQMISLNRSQAEFYDRIQEAEEHQASHGYSANDGANAITRLIAALRYQQQRAVATTGIRDRVRQLHLDWIASKAGGCFLEIGCFSGSDYTFELIDAADHYVGIELSEAACSSLRRKVEFRGQANKAEIVCGDFLEVRAGS